MVLKDKAGFNFMEWVSEASKGRNFHVEKNLTHTCIWYRGDLFVCLSIMVLEILNHFWTDETNLDKKLGDTWFAFGNYWVGSNPSQSPPAWAWSWSRPFPWSLSPPWSLLLSVMWHHFRKHLANQTKVWEWICEFGHKPALMGYEDGGRRGVNIFRIGTFSLK